MGTGFGLSPPLSLSLAQSTRMNVYEKLADPLAFTVFCATLLLPVAVGLLTMRRTRSQEDFLVGGRALGCMVVALSAVSSGRSSWLVLGVSGMAYMRGVGALWAVVGYTLVELVQCLTLGKRLREETGRRSSITLLDYLEERVGDRSHLVRGVGALIIVVFTTAYVAAQLSAGARTLVSALGVSLEVGLLAAGALILVYMLLGGFIAVAYNDVVRALIMLLGLLVLPALAIGERGGVRALAHDLAALDPTMIDPFALGMGALIGFVGIGLGSPGQPHILVRYMAIGDAGKLRSAAWIGFAWNVVLGAGALAIGLAGRVLHPDVEGLPGADSEMIYLVLSSELFGPLVYGVLVGGVFAAILSTADSQLLVVASTFARDIFERLLRAGRQTDEASRVLVSRAVLLLAGLVAMGLAYAAEDLVFWLVLFAWGGLGAALGPTLILALFWRGTTRSGVLAGMLTGSTTVIVWRLWLKEPTGLYELIPAFALALVITWSISLVTGKASPRAAP